MNFFYHSRKLPAFFVFFILVFSSFWAGKAHAATSPYATVQTNVPLNQATNDSINGILPYFVSHTTVEGPVDTLIDATSTNTPDGNVILGPDNTWVGVAWDFGDPAEGFVWKLSRIDVWISAGDELRRGIRADFSVSSTGGVDEFTVISNSLHWAALSQNSQFNYLRYDFPDQFIAGATNNMDRYPVNGFRYLRLNSRGDSPSGGVDWQTRFAELDVWVTQIPSPDRPVFSSVKREPNGDVTLNWSAILGRTYNLEYKTDLNQSSWIFLEAIVADSETESAVDESTAGSQRFYRVGLQP